MGGDKGKNVNNGAKGSGVLEKVLYPFSIVEKIPSAEKCANHDSNEDHGDDCFMNLPIVTTCQSFPNIGLDEVLVDSGI